MGSAGCPRIAVGNKEQPFCARFFEDPIQRGPFIGAGGEGGVAVTDGDFVPLADAGGVGVLQINLPGRAEGHERRGIIHHRGAAVRAGGEVVGQPEGVADLMRRQLPQAGQRHLFHARVHFLSEFIFRDQPLGDQVILAHAQRAEGHLPLDDFARARVGDGDAVGPAAGGAMHPLDQVVADVHGVGFSGQQLHPEGIAKSGGLECLRPPARTVEERGTDGFGRAGIEVINDRLHRLAQGGGGVALFQSVPRNNALHDGFADGHGVIHVVQAEVAGAGVVAPRDEGPLGQRDE